MVRTRGIMVSLLTLTLTAGAWAQDALPTVAVETVAEPVLTARINGPTLAQDAAGRWQFIAQAMNYKGTTDFTYSRHTVPGTDREYLTFNETDQRPDAEWVVVDLESGESRIFDLPGFHGGAPVRADNGRVFFFVDFMHVWYYEPADGEMKMLGELSEWVPFTNDRTFYKTTLGPDGKIYATTQSYSGKTAVVQIDPDELTWKIIHNVGVNRPSGLTYGYYMGLGLPWVYVAVGQDHWELMAVNIDTGEQRHLGERTGEKARVVVNDDDKGGVTAELMVGGVKEVFWCIDGKIVPVEAGAEQPRAAMPSLDRPEAPQPPELDKDRPVRIAGDGSGTIYWRPAGSEGEWRSATFQIERAEPAHIESLTALPDGTLLGNTYSYNGWFSYDPAAGASTFLDKIGPSRARTTLHEGKVYFAGYPNSHMSVFDTARPWRLVDRAALNHADNNPRQIGSFGQGVTEAHYATVLLPGPNQRIYLVGKRERWSTGTGLGYYDIASGQRIGLGEDMKDYYAQGAALLPAINRIVISGKGPDAAGQFRVYDMDLQAQEPLTVKAGLETTGLIQGIGHDSRVLGWIDGETSETLYLYDVADEKIVAWQELDKPAAPSTDDPGTGSWWAEAGKLRTYVAFQKPGDGSWWMLRGNTLCQLNPETLELTPTAQLDRHFEMPLWIGQDIYGVIGGQLVKATP